MPSFLNLEPLRKALSEVIGQECWSSLGGVGSHFYLDLGKKVCKTKPTHNPHLQEDQRNFKGEYTIGVLCDEWELSRLGVPITDSDEPCKVLTDRLLALEGERLLNVNEEAFNTVSTEGLSRWSILLEFTDNYRLLVHVTDDSVDKFVVKTPSGWWGIESIDGEVVSTHEPA